MQTLKGRTCVFSGASAGDGVEAVKTLCAGGMNVVMLTHQLETAQRLIDEIRSMGLPGECIALAGSGDTDPADLLPYIPIGRLGTAKDLGELIAFLASEESGYITGQTISLSGGLELRV